MGPKIKCKERVKAIRIGTGRVQVGLVPKWKLILITTPSTLIHHMKRNMDKEHKRVTTRRHTMAGSGY